MDKKTTLDICDRVAQLRTKVAGKRGKANFAKMLGLSPSTYDYYESVRIPPATTLVKIAELAKCDLRWLLTGEGNEQPDALFGHPAVKRAAQILDRFPDAANPLVAFLDLLEQALELKQGKSGKVIPVSDSPAIHDIPDFTNMKVLGEDQISASAYTAEISNDSKSKGFATIRPIDSNADSVWMNSTKLKQADSIPDFSAGWIPVLGRSAAGVSHFWAESEDVEGITKLGDLISDHASTVADMEVLPAKISGISADKVEIIQLPKPIDDSGMVEFINVPEVKSQLPGIFAVRIDGESMSPEINHGDLVLLSADHHAKANCPAVVQLKDAIGVTCKLFHRQGDSLHLVPINESYPHVSVSEDEIQWALSVLGCIKPDPKIL